MTENAEQEWQADCTQEPKCLKGWCTGDPACPHSRIPNPFLADYEARRDMLAHSPMGAHWCDKRHREHFEPCRCQCEPCREAVAPNTDSGEPIRLPPLEDDLGRMRSLGWVWNGELHLFPGVTLEEDGE
jgi:hypothetical protein